MRQHTGNGEEAAPSPKRRRGSVLGGDGDGGSIIDAAVVVGDVTLAEGSPMDTDEPLQENENGVVAKPVLKEGAVTYHDAIKNQEAARRYMLSFSSSAGNYGGMSSTLLGSTNLRKAPEIKMKMGQVKK
jgi:hypothetical protein